MSYGVRMVYKRGMQSGGENGVQMGCAEWCTKGVYKGGVQSVVWEEVVGWEMCEMRVDYWPERWERAKSRIGSMPRTKSCGKLWTSQPSVGSTPVSI